MKLKKNDFIEIEFTSRKKDDNEVFDSNIEKDLKKINPDIKPDKAEPFVFSLGQGMFLKGVEDFLIGKDIGKKKEFKIELPAEKAFGKRQSKFIQKMPTKIFKEHNLNPVPGFMFNFDGRLGKVLAASGGRVIVDFNNPVAGKDVVYDVKILRKIKNLNEKVKAFNKFLFKRDLDFEIDEKNKKIILYTEEQMKKFAEMFSEKYKDIFNLDLEVKKLSEKNKPKDKKQNKKKTEKNKSENKRQSKKEQSEKKSKTNNKKSQ